MDIRTLNERTGIAVRQLRYVLDHKLVPARTWFLDEHSVGRSRTFGETTAVFIACAAFLLDAGYKRDAVRTLMASIAKVRPSGRNPLNVPVIGNVVIGNGAARVQFADGKYVRWIQGRTTGDWIEPGSPMEVVPDLAPRVIVELNISEIRDLVRDNHRPS